MLFCFRKGYQLLSLKLLGWPNPTQPKLTCLNCMTTKFKDLLGVSRGGKNEVKKKRSSIDRELKQTQAYYNFPLFILHNDQYLWHIASRYMQVDSLGASHDTTGLFWTLSSSAEFP